MTIWNNKSIDVLQDDELKDAFIRLKSMNDAYNKIKESDEYKEKMKNRAKPNGNPAFVELYEDVTKEFNKRNLVI